MNYILTMTLSGTLLYIAYRILVKYKGSETGGIQYYNLLKCVMLYFVVPLPFLKHFYEEICKHFKTTSEWTKPMYFMLEEPILIQDGNGYIPNDTMKIHIAILAIWMLGAMVVSGIFLIRYLKRKRMLEKSGYIAVPKEDEQLVNEITGKLKLKRKITLIVCREEVMPFCIGFLRPVIVYPESYSLDEKRMIFTHELTHIKNADIVWKLLALYINVLHWYNPFAWFVKADVEKECEYIADASVVSGKDKLYCRQYANFLVDCMNGRKGETLVNYLSKDGKEMKNRLRKIINRNDSRVNKFKSTFVVALLVLANSMTVFAYEDVKIARPSPEQEKEKYEEAIADFFEGDIVIVPDGMVAEYEIPEEYVYHYDLEFVDEEGNIYELKESGAEVCAVCEYEYITGTIRNHAKDANGGCTIYYYEAIYCIKCAAYESIKELYHLTYPACAHQ